MLTALTRDGHDDEASRIICATAAKLHAPRNATPPKLIPLAQWFRDLDPAAAKYGGILMMSAATARELLATEHEISVLHGDVHHGNILDFGDRGWLAIDPKGLIGERGFDFANIFCNPDQETAVNRARFTRQVSVVAEAAALDPKRLLQWILAWGGLSAAWQLSDGYPPDISLGVAELAASELCL